MKTSTKIYIGVAFIVALLMATTIASVWVNRKITSLEREIENARSLAAEKQTAADEKERQAAEYKAKNEYLEQKLAEVQNAARKQDEELEKLSNNVDSARSRVERARRVRSVAATADELCAKLADLGHACQ